jgi:light-regulated signal transduction histidine kinase (bacteriophytochrome)
MTGHGTIDTAVAAMQVGALDYVLKPFKLNVILTVIVRALDIRRLRLENAALQQREREQAIELAAAYRDLESFSYSVSHDLRSPLRAVNGFMDIFMEEFGNTVSGEARAHLEQVRAGGARMDRLIEDLLKFCRFSRTPLTRQRVNLDAIVRRVVAELRTHEPARTVDIEIGELPGVAGDPSLLEQVIVNLLSNAFKFTRHQAQARIAIGSFAAPDPANPSAQERVFFVRDNGAGFDMKYADKLFGVFQRLHAQNQFEGTGVGLSIVQRVLQRHGGRIWAESAPDHGATFFFVLPVEP